MKFSELTDGQYFVPIERERKESLVLLKANGRAIRVYCMNHSVYSGEEVEIRPGRKVQIINLHR